MSDDNNNESDLNIYNDNSLNSKDLLGNLDNGKENQNDMKYNNNNNNNDNNDLNQDMNQYLLSNEDIMPYSPEMLQDLLKPEESKNLSNEKSDSKKAIIYGSESDSKNKNSNKKENNNINSNKNKIKNNYKKNK